MARRKSHYNGKRITRSEHSKANPDQGRKSGAKNYTFARLDLSRPLGTPTF